MLLIEHDILIKKEDKYYYSSLGILFCLRYNKILQQMSIW